MIFLPAVFGRPMPNHRWNLTCLVDKPIPLYLTPQFVRQPPDFNFVRVRSGKIFARKQDAFHQERGFYNISAVIIFAEWNRQPRFTIDKMRKSAMKTLRLAREKF